MIRIVSLENHKPLLVADADVYELRLFDDVTQQVMHVGFRLGALTSALARGGERLAIGMICSELAGALVELQQAGKEAP